MFQVEDLQSALDELGIDWRMSGKSLAVKDCPACGSSNFKVLFNLAVHKEGEQFFGRCVKGSCEEKYSSMKYLIMSGMDKIEALSVHQLDPSKQIKSVFESSGIIHNTQIPEIPKQFIDISNFCNVDDFPDHAVSKYAKKRGFVSKFKDLMKIDLTDNSVVFLVLQDDVCTEFQKRFVSPYAKPKTKFSSGFKKEQPLIFDGGKDIMVCEGPFTALSAAHYGFKGVCTFGAEISKSYMKYIIQLQTWNQCNVIYAAENQDAASNKALMRFRAQMVWAGIKFSIATPDTGKDLNDSWQAGSGYKIQEDTKNPWISDVEFKF